MARYNVIYAGPTTEVRPQVQELPAAASTLPGCAVVINAGTFALAGAATTGKVFLAQDNYLTCKGVDDAYGADETTIGMEMLDEQFFNVRVPTGVNVTRGAALSTVANGKWGLATDGRPVYAYAEEAFNNTTGADQLVRVRAAKGYLLPAA